MFNNMCFFPLWSSGSKNPHNTDGDVAFEVKKPESEVYVSSSCSAQTKKHNDKTKREAKGKNPVELSTGYRNLSAEFEDFSDNSISEVNADDSPVPVVGQISTNSTNTFSAAGPFNTGVSPTHGKSLYMDPSQYPDDPNMPALEDITYSDDEEDVGAEADFTNLETNITVSPILTTRVHKDHHEEGIDYKEVFAPVARIEAIRFFLAYAFFMGFMVYQMDVKSGFLCGTIEEEVYVCQPLGFEDPDYPDKVYKVVKALYGLHQAPRAWYETLANYLLENGFQMGKIDQTLFIKKQKGDILLVQVYIDDIIFGSTNKDLCKAFEKLMKDKFQLSSMGELIFYLGLQVKQKPDRIFISQDKYVVEILRKFGLTDGKSASTPKDIEKLLLKDPDGEDVDVHTYRSMIGSLMYLTSSRPDIILISWQCKKQTVVATSSTEAEYVAAASCCAQVLWIQNQLLGYGKVEALEQDNVAQPLEIIQLKQRVKKLERKNKLKVSGLRRLRNVGTTQRIKSSVDTVMDDQEDASKHGEIIPNINADEDVILKDVDVVDKTAKIKENADVQGRSKESQAQIYKIDLEHADKVLSMQDDDATITAATTLITAATITNAPSAARRRKRVVTRDPEETATPSIIIRSKPKSKDKGKGIMIEEPKPLKKQAQIEQDEAYAREKPQTEAQARRNMMIYLRNMAGFKMDYFKGMSYDDIHPIFKKYFNSNVAFLEKTKDQPKEKESRALKRKTESQEEKAVKKQKLDEEVEELKKHLKVPVVDYEIYSENNKPYFKIIRADGTHQLFMSFLSLLRNFDREDLEPDVEAQVWKSQRSVYGLAKVKSWRLLESCGVYVKTLTTTQMILLVERRYPLTRFTLNQMLNNVHLEVEEESKVSLELLRFVRQQQKEGFRPE
nr:putative ribonuclease H-like domain-containing protein [Tanacetum cinerariifolium]